MPHSSSDPPNRPDPPGTGKKVYIIGEVGIAEELDLIGVPHIGGPADKGKTIDLTPGTPNPGPNSNPYPNSQDPNRDPTLTPTSTRHMSGFALDIDHDVGAVVVGFDRGKPQLQPNAYHSPPRPQP